MSQQRLGPLDSGPSSHGLPPDAGADGPASHALAGSDLDVTPPDSAPDSGGSSPGAAAAAAATDYSPHSQPFAERPQHRTAAGAAARQSISALPSPPPFTPHCASRLSAGGGRPAPPSQASSRASGADTPGVTSAWAGGGGGGSASRQASSSATFAFTPLHGGRDEIASPDAGWQPAQHWQALPARASSGGASLLPQPGAPPSLSGPAASTPGDSGATSGSAGGSASAISSGRTGSQAHGPSPSHVLRQAADLVRRGKAISGSKRLNSKAYKTPAAKGIAAAPTPHSTPLDVNEQRACADQLTLLAGAASAAAIEEEALEASAESDTPAAAASPAPPPAASPAPGAVHISTTASASPSPGKAGKSPSSVVSIGSVCGPAPATPPQLCSDELEPGLHTPSRKLDFGSTPASAGVNFSMATTPGLADWSPLTLEQLAGTLQDSTTKVAARRQLLMDDGDEPAGRAGGRASLPGAATGAAPLGSGAAACEQLPAGAPADSALPPRSRSARPTAAPSRSWARHSGAGLLWLLAGVALVAGTFLAVELLPPGTAPPGAVCTPDNAAVCSQAWEAAWAAAQREPPAWRLAVLRAKWYLEDAADIFVRRRLPRGVSQEQLAAVWLRSISDAQLQGMSPAFALQLFGDLPAETLPPRVAAKLAAAVEEQAAAERAAAEKAAAERAAAERAAAERAAAEKAAAERAAAERAAAEKAAAERAAAEKAAAERAAAERAAAEKAAAEKAAAEKAAAEKAAAEKAAAERAAAEKAATERAAAERAAAEKAAAEQAAAKQAAAEQAAAQQAAAQQAAAEQAAVDRPAVGVPGPRLALKVLQAAAALTVSASCIVAALFFWPWLVARRRGAAPRGVSADEDAADAEAALAGPGAPALTPGGRSFAAAAAALRAQQAEDDALFSDDELGGGEDEDAAHEEAHGAGASTPGALQRASSLVAATVRILTPSSKPPLPPGAAAASGWEQPDAAGEAEAEDDAIDGAGPSAAAAAGRTPRSATRSGGVATRRRSTSRGTAADSDGEPVPPSSGRARRGAAAATPRRGARLSALPENAPAELPDAGDQAEEEQQDGLRSDEEVASAPGGRRTRRQSAPAASGRRRSASAATAAAEASTPRATRRSTRSTRTPGV